jgi:hypothetical protein
MECHTITPLKHRRWFLDEEMGPRLWFIQLTSRPGTETRDSQLPTLNKFSPQQRSDLLPPACIPAIDRTLLQTVVVSERPVSCSSVSNIERTGSHNRSRPRWSTPPLTRLCKRVYHDL